MTSRRLVLPVLIAAAAFLAAGCTSVTKTILTPGEIPAGRRVLESLQSADTTFPAKRLLELRERLEEGLKDQPRKEGEAEVRMGVRVDLWQEGSCLVRYLLKFLSPDSADVRIGARVSFTDSSGRLLREERLEVDQSSGILSGADKRLAKEILELALPSQ